MNKKILKEKPSWKAGFMFMVLLAFALLLCVQLSASSLPIALEDKAGLSIDNKVNYVESIKPPINSTYEIYDSSYLFFKGDKLASLTLKENTFSCGDNCLWEQNIENLVDSQLVEDNRFYRIIYEEDNVTEKERYLSNVRSFNMYLVEYELKEVEDYETQCQDTGKYSINGTAIQECSEVLVGTHNETTESLTPYNYEILKAGNYTLRGVGTKRADWTYDWQVKKNGVWTEEWSTWGVRMGSGILYYNPKSLGSHSGYPNIFGFQIKPNKNLTINQIIKGSGVTATRSFIINSSGGIINQSVFNGNIAITSNNLLEVGKIYYVGVDAGGSSFTDGGIAATGFPFYNETFNWTAGLDNYPLGGNPVLNIRTDTVYSITALNISVNIILSNITINSPLNNSYLNNSLVNFNVTTNVVGGANATNITLYLNGIANETKIITGATNTTIFTKNLNEGIYNQSYIACDTDGDCGNSSVYTFTIDASAPIINITSPTFENYLYQNKTLDLNYSITDATSNLSACWYIYNGVTKNLNCSLTNTTFNYSVGQDLIQVYANDTLNNIANVNQSWGYYVIEKSVSYQPSIFESEQTLITANFTLPYVPSSVILTYDNTNYNTSILSNGTDYIFYKTITSPIVNSPRNVSFNFTIVTNGETIITNTYNQYVQDIVLTTNCIGNYTVLNMTNYNEETLGVMGGTIDYLLNLKNTDNEILSSLNGSASGTNVRLCSVVNLSQSSSLYELQLRYYNTSGFGYKTYNIEPTNCSYLPNNINLYYLNDSIGTEFTINYKDYDYFKHPGAIIQIQRQYLSDNSYKVVEIPLISDDGTTTGTFNTLSVKYKLIVIEKGEILDIFENIYPVCQNLLTGVCEVNLRGTQTGGVVVGDDFTYTITSTNNTLTLTYIIPSGDPASVQLETIQESKFIDVVSDCNSSTYASGGTLVCTYNNTVGESIVAVNIVKNGVTIINGNIQVSEDINSLFLVNNYFIAFVMLMTLVLIFASSGIMMILSAVAGIFYLGFVFLIVKSSLNIFLVSSSLIWLIIAAVTLIYKLGQKEERT